MVEANHSLSQIQARITRASFVFALERARNAVKEELKKQRRRLADVEAKEVSARAHDYLCSHPELVLDARPVIESWIRAGKFGKRAQRAFCAKLESDAQRESAWSVERIGVQISWTKWSLEMIVGYARVSTDGQSLEAQHAALRAAGCEKVFAEKVSGAKTDRAQLAKAIAALGESECIEHVTKEIEVRSGKTKWEYRKALFG
jgi:Resolvase, N terminal domain